jgi:3D (Asp-Asp-Asp) domain-containing protein
MSSPNLTRCVVVFLVLCWITACGRRPSPAPVPLATLSVRTTAYTHQEKTQQKWGLVTASGAPLQATAAHNSAAADWSRFPVGTVFRIPGHPERFVIEDYGKALVGEDAIDIYRAEPDAVAGWGTRQLDVEVLEWGSLERSRDILKTRLHVPYCRSMYEAIEAKLR